MQGSDISMYVITIDLLLWQAINFRLVWCTIEWDLSDIYTMKTIALIQAIVCLTSIVHLKTTVKQYIAYLFPSGNFNVIECWTSKSTAIARIQVSNYLVVELDNSQNFKRASCLLFRWGSPDCPVYLFHAGFVRYLLIRKPAEIEALSLPSLMRSVWLPYGITPLIPMIVLPFKTKSVFQP